MVYNKYLDKEEEFTYKKESTLISTFKKIFSFKNILFIVLTFLVLPQTFLNDVYPYGYVIFGVAALFNVPLALVLISGVLSTIVFSIPSFVLLKMFISFVVFTLLTALVNIQGVSKKNVILIKLIFSVIVTEIIAMLIKGIQQYNFIDSVYSLMVTIAMYLVFASGIYVLLNLGKKYVFSKEESLAMVVVTVISLGFLKEFNIYGISVLNIITTGIIIMYGYRSGAIMASAAGLVSALILSVSSETSILYITVLTFSGFISGFFSRYGKIAVIISFVISNLLINYWANGFSNVVIRLSESIIASFAILLIPKKLEEKFDNIFDQNSTLNRAYEGVLDSSGFVKNRLNAVSEVFNDLSKVIIHTDEKTKSETKDVIQKYILNYLENNFIEYKSRIDKVENLTKIYAEKLEKNEDIENIEFIFDTSNSKKINKEICEVYNSIKLVRIVKSKEEENSKILASQYKEVSNILSNISNNLKQNKTIVTKKQKGIREELKIAGYTVYEDDFKDDNNCIEYTFLTDILTDIDEQKQEISEIVSNILEDNMIVKYIFNSSKNEKSKIRLISKPKNELKVSIVAEKKEKEEVSGDSYISMELEDLNYINILSDGTGSGKEANKASKIVINTLEKLLKSGFEKEKSIEIVNSVMKLKSNEDMTATLDMFVYNLKNSISQFIKIGAAPTYILENNKISIVKSLNIPIGIFSESDYITIEKKLNKDSLIIQITDGVLNENEDIKDNYFTKALESMDITKNTKQISEELKKLVVKNKNGKITDDFTIIVSKVK